MFLDPPANYGMAEGPNVGQPQARQPYPGQPMLQPGQQIIYRYN